MNALSMVVGAHGAPDVVQRSTSPVAQPGPGQLLVAVEAAGVAYADVLMRRGVYPETPRLPFTPGYDVVGRVVALGPGVEGFAVGTRVAALTVTGGYSTRALASAALAVAVPEQLPAAEVTALTLNYVTAHQMLHRIARVPAGSTVLVLGAAGGVGTALLELAALAGIAVVGTASGRRTDAVTSRGATAIDRATEDVAARVRELAPSGVAAVFDPVGGDQLRRSRTMAASDGVVVSYGLSFAVDEGRGRVSALVRQGLALVRAKTTPGARTALYVIAGRRGYATRHPEHFRADLAQLVRLLQAGRLSPAVSTMPLTAAAQAHARLESGGVTGKLVLQVDDGS